MREREELAKRRGKGKGRLDGREGLAKRGGRVRVREKGREG